MRVNTSTSPRAIGAISVRNTSGSLSIKEARVRDAMTLRQVFLNMRATVSPSFVQGSGRSGGTIAVTSSSATVAVTGGTPPYAYAWTTDNGSVLPVSPSTASTAFRGFVEAGEALTADGYCTVTDSGGSHATSGTVAITVRNTATPA